MGKGCCKNCGAANTRLYKHHIVPKVRGGSDSEGNLIYLCIKCHGLAHNVDFGDEGLVKDGTNKVRSEYKLAATWAEENEGRLLRFLGEINDVSWELHDYLVSALNLDLISSDFFYSILHKRPKKPKPTHLKTTVSMRDMMCEIWDGGTNE